MEAGNANKKFVFYGAGGYARTNLDRLISAGYTPLCFVDSDMNKHNTLFGDTGITIASLDSALAEYPGCRFLLTVGVNIYREVHAHLRSRGITSDRIECPDDVVYRKGCPMSESTMVIGADVIELCCGHSLYNVQGLPWEPAFSFPFDVASDDSIASAVNAYEEAMAVLLEKWTNFEKTPCDECGCPYLQKGVYPKTVKMQTVVTGCFFADEICNFSCVYCLLDGETKRNAGMRDVIMKLAGHIDCRDTIFSFATGEFLARRDCDEILRFLYDKGAKFYLTSNSSIYSETLASLIREGRVGVINTSLDAGTAETFAKVKGVGVDCFKKTVDNISQYSRLGVGYCLKYLILPGINDNEEDIYGFVDICDGIRPACAIVSTDRRKRGFGFEKRTMDMAFLLHDKLVGRDLKVVWDFAEFNADDIKTIRSRVGERI